jgi:hypothetical protein
MHRRGDHRHAVAVAPARMARRARLRHREHDVLGLDRRPRTPRGAPRARHRPLAQAAAFHRASSASSCSSARSCSAPSRSSPRSSRRTVPSGRPSSMKRMPRGVHRDQRDRDLLVANGLRRGRRWAW